MLGLKALLAGYVLYLLSFCKQSAGQTETYGSMSEELHPVESCPADADSWRKAGIRLKCPIDKYGRNLYQCAPNEHKTDLVEFCLKGSIGRYEEGLCVFAYPSRELHVDYCETFEYGCPENSYIGDEIYKYPACLEINRDAGCYVADPKCPPSSRTPPNPQDSVDVTVVVVSSLLSVIGIVVGIILLFWCTYKTRSKRKQDSNGERRMEIVYDTNLPLTETSKMLDSPPDRRREIVNNTHQPLAGVSRMQDDSRKMESEYNSINLDKQITVQSNRLKERYTDVRISFLLSHGSVGDRKIEEASEIMKEKIVEENDFGMWKTNKRKPFYVFRDWINTDQENCVDEIKRTLVEVLQAAVERETKFVIVFPLSVWIKDTVIQELRSNPSCKIRYSS